MLDRSQLHFAHVTTVTLSWRVQNFVVIGLIDFKPQHCNFWSNYEFDRNSVSGTGAWSLARCLVVVHYSYAPLTLDTLPCTGVVVWGHPGPLFTKQTDVLPQDPVKSRSREIRVFTVSIALKFKRHLGSSAVEMPVKFQSYVINITPNIAVSRLHETWR